MAQSPYTTPARAIPGGIPAIPITRDEVKRIVENVVDQSIKRLSTTIGRALNDLQANICVENELTLNTSFLWGACI